MRSTLLISILALPALAIAQSDRIDLFSFVMPDAQLIAGANVNAAKTSPFGQFVLSQIPMGEKYLSGFMNETGIDPRSDISEVVAAWNGTPSSSAKWVIGAHGNFGPSIETIEVNMLKNGGAITRLPGVDLIEAGQPGINAQTANICIGLFTDGFTDIIGDCTTVHGAVEFGAVTGTSASSLALKAQQLRSQQDLWFASVVPVAQFANVVVAGNSGAVNLSSVLKGNLFQAIQQITGGVKFVSTAQNAGAQFSAEVMMDTPQDATSLLNVVNFIVGLLKMNSGAGPAAGGIAALLGDLDASANGSVLTIGANIPESTLEQLFLQVSQLATTSVPALSRQ